MQIIKKSTHTQDILNKTNNELLPSQKTAQAKMTKLTELAYKIKDETGLVQCHLIPFQQLAKSHNTIIGVRPVSPLATQFIEEGYPTKDFHIKGKSASWGPQAGLICVKQELSKLEDQTAENICKYNKKVQDNLHQGRAINVPIILTKNRLQSLLEKNCITDSKIDFSQFSAKAPSGKTYNFTAKLVVNNRIESYQIFECLHGKNIPLEALAPNKEGKISLPYTADYDLMLIAPQTSDLSTQDNLPVSDVSHELYKKRIDSYKNTPAHKELMVNYQDATIFYQNSDPDIGSATKRIADFIPKINKALVGSDGESVVHHSADSSNPASEPKDNFPLTMFLPRNIGEFNEICIINDKTELSSLIQVLKNNGFHVPINPLWDSDTDKPDIRLQDLRRESFTQAREDLEKRWCKSIVNP